MIQDFEEITGKGKYSIVFHEALIRQMLIRAMKAEDSSELNTMVKYLERLYKVLDQYKKGGMETQNFSGVVPYVNLQAFVEEQKNTALQSLTRQSF